MRGGRRRELCRETPPARNGSGAYGRASPGARRSRTERGWPHFQPCGVSKLGSPTRNRDSAGGTRVLKPLRVEERGTWELNQGQWPLHRSRDGQRRVRRQVRPARERLGGGSILRSALAAESRLGSGVNSLLWRSRRCSRRGAPGSWARSAEAPRSDGGGRSRATSVSAGPCRQSSSE